MKERNGKRNYASRSGEAGATMWLFKTPLILQIAVEEGEKRLKLDVFGFTAEGTPVDLAVFTFVLVDAFKQKADYDKKKEVDEWLEKYGNKTFEELMRMESDGEE